MTFYGFAAVSTVVAFCSALLAAGLYVGAEAEITDSVPAGVHYWRACPKDMSL